MGVSYKNRVHLQLTPSDLNNLKSNANMLLLDVNSYLRLLVNVYMNDTHQLACFDDLLHYHYDVDGDIPLKSIFINLTDDQMKWLNNVTYRYNVSRSLVLRYIITHYTLAVNLNI